MAGKFESTPAERDAGLILQQEMQTAMKQRADAQARGDQAALKRANNDIDALTADLKTLGSPRARQTDANSGNRDFSTSSSSSSTSTTVKASTSAPAPSVPGPNVPGPNVVDSVMAAISPESALKAQQDYLTSAAYTYAGARRDAGQIDDLNALTLLDAENLTQMAAQQNLVKNREQFSIVQQANLDPSKGDNAYFTAMDAVAINEQEYAQARSAFDQAQSVDFFSDPLGYFQAQLSLPQLANKVNQLAAKGDAVEADFQRRARMSSVGRETMFSDQSTQTYEMQLAAGKAKVREGQAALLQAKVDRGIKLTDQDLQMAQSLGVFQGSTLTNLQRAEVTKAKTAAEDEEARLKAAVENFNKYAGTDYTVPGLKTLGPAISGPILNSSQGSSLPVSTYVTAAGRAGEMNKLGEYQALYGGAKKILAKVQDLQRRTPQYQGKDGYAQAEAAFMQASNAAVSGEDKRGMLTGEQDNAGNPHRIDHALLSNGVKLARQTGARPPVPPDNIVLQLLDKEMKANQRTEDGNIPAHVERKVLEYLIDRTGKGALTDQVTGKKIMPADLSKIIAQYYEGAATYQQNLRKLEIVGVPRALSYAVKLEGMDAPVDVRNPTQVEYMISRVQAAQNSLWNRTPELLGEVLEGFTNPSEMVRRGVRPIGQ